MELLEPRVVLAAPDQWLQRGIAAGGVLLEPSISPHNPNEIYLGSDMSQMFHTKDAGQSWGFENFLQFKTSNLVSGVQFTSDPNVLFAIDHNTSAFPTPLRSTDGGATWQRPGATGFASNWKSTEQAWALFADPNSSSRLVVATQDELYLSTDAGATFTSAYTYTGTVNSSLKLGLHLAGVFFDGSNIYAATNAGFLVSSNGGSFQAAKVGSTPVANLPSGETFFAFAGATDGTTIRFWAISHNPTTISTPQGHTAANASGSNVFGGYVNVYSLDWGQTAWTAKATGLPATADLSYVEMANNDINTVYVGGQNTVNNVQSIYIGKYTTTQPSWTSLFTTSGPSSNIVTGYVGQGGHVGFSPSIEGLTVDPQNSSRVMMSDGWSAHLSSDGGALWQQMYVPLSQDHAAGTAIPKTQTYNNTGMNNTTVWWVQFNSPTSIFTAYDDIKWQRSTDGGATWTFDVSGLNQQMENFSIETDKTTGRLFMAQGRSWAAHDILGLPDSSVTQGGGDIAYSDDGGATWKTLYNFNNPVSWTALDPNDSKTMYASVIDPDPSVGGVYVSHNIDAVNTGGSVTFTRLAAQPSSVNVGKPHTIEVLKDGTLVVVLTARKYDHDNNPATADIQSAGSGVFRLDPGASAWVDVTGSNMHYWCKDLTVDPADASQQTWYVAVATSLAPNAGVAGQPSNQPGLYMTTNRGASWSRVFTKDTDSVAVNPANPTEAYLASSANGLWYSSNLRLADGVTINPSPTFTQLTSFPHVRPNRVFFNPYSAGEVWVGTNGAGMIVGNASTPHRTFEFSAPTFSVNEGAGTATLTVTRSGDNNNAMSVDYLVSDGTATNGSDYISANIPSGITGTLTFLPGQSSTTFTLPIVDDAQVEGSQTILVSLSGPLGGNFLGTNANATLTIVDNDVLPALSINDVSINEGNSGQSTATFTVTLSAASSQSVTVDFATAAASASNADYTQSAGTLTFAAGQTSQTISITVLGDLVDEADETFNVNLSNASNATLADSAGLGTIVDDDAAPALSINDVTVTEGNSGQTNANFTVSLDAPSSQTVQVDYATADSSASSANDYQAATGTLSFAPGETTKTVTVAINGDSAGESNEQFQLSLLNAINAVMADSLGLGTILDDDIPAISIGDASVTEGNAGTITAKFAVTLSSPSNQTVTVKYDTAAASATAPKDFTTTTGTLTFAAGTTSQTVSISVKGDVLDELNETFLVNLSNPTNATLSDNQAVGTIIDDDATPSLTIKDVTLTEGNTGTKSATFTVSLSAASGQNVTVDYATSDNTALAGSDYLATNGTLTIPAGTTSKTFSVSVSGDVLDEPQEKFFVDLSNATNATIADAQAVAIINDNDPTPTLKISDISATESDNSPTNATFTVTLSAASGQSVSVNYATANVSALAGSDYVSQTGTLTFAPGETSKTFAVSVLGDVLDEANETFQVNLSGATNGTIAGGRATATIVDNDPTPSLSINDVTLVEGHNGQTNMTFTVSLSAASAQVVTVRYATANGTATSSDYVTTSGTLTFAAGTTTKTITVSIKGDLLRELNETFFVNLSNATNAIFADAQGLAVITDDD